MSIILDGSNANTVGIPNLGTAQASTSGTAITFTGIPSGVKRITVMFNGVSTSGSSDIQIRIGSGSVDTSGYSGSGGYFVGGSTSQVNNYTAGFGFITAASSAVFALFLV